ncbi:MAG TPA: hypothetical protein VJT82_03480 [Pyrinomonadaceae bacterium]|nr:hypothetical protein [Pyrinomonadaceae bacterium]
MFRRMSRRSGLRELVALLMILAIGLSFTAAAVQKKAKKKKATPTGTPVLWREPEDIASRDLLLGPGGEAMKPDLSRVTFIKEETGGTNKKYRVRDAAGREWVAKLGKEAQSETAAVRLLWAVGYVTEINYHAPRVNIEGKGSFEDVRFEARPKGVKRLDEWKWEKNPFTGKREFQGLKVMMLLINNWDIKDANNKIFHVKNDQTGEEELQYVISDLGATFGKTGSLPVFWRITRSRNDPKAFADATFVEDVKKGYVFFKYGGKMQDIFEDISVEDVRWIAALLTRLSDQQIADAFRAADYTPEEIDILAGAVRARIGELANLPPESN